jgi:predicted transposase/invertase (TIGR01784 family)
MKRKLISFDWAIKRILRSKANFDILEGFLSELLKEDIKILEVLESESNKECQEDKYNRLDIKVKNEKEEIILVEIQYSRELDYLQRILYASSKAIVEHLKEGVSYKGISKIITISILYFNFGDGDDYIYHGTTSFVGIHKKDKLQLTIKQQELYNTESVEKLYPEHYLIKVTNFNDYAKDSLDEWINFLKNEEIPDNPKAKGLKKAKEKLDYLKMSEEEKKEYNRHIEEVRRKISEYESTYVVGKIDGRIEGIEIGENKAKIEIAKNLLKAGVDIETIQISTGLKKETIENLNKNR